MTDKCIYCKRKVCINNMKNLQCKSCTRLCHPKCAKNIPPISLKKSGAFRFKIVRNVNWECQVCILKKLPCSNISNFHFRDIASSSKSNVNDLNSIAKPVQSSNKLKLAKPEELNKLFMQEYDESEFELTNFSNKTKYTYSHDISEMIVSDGLNSYKDFPIISLNIRSIVNYEHFMKFEALLASLPIKPKVIGLTETWIKDSSQGPHDKIRGYTFIKNNRKNSPGGGVGFYVSDELHFTKIEDISIMKEKVFESRFYRY